MKRLAPIVITLLVSLFLAAYVVLMQEGLWSIKNIAAGFILFIICGFFIGIIIALVFTLKERLEEIDKEDPNDISKY